MKHLYLSGLPAQVFYCCTPAELRASCLEVIALDNSGTF